MIEFARNHPDKLIIPLIQHIQLVGISLVISIVLSSLLTTIAICIPRIANILIYGCSIIYSAPSLALFVILIPFTGLGEKSAIIVLVFYNQYILLRNFIEGLNQVDEAVIEAARGMGMRELQILKDIRIPLSISTIVTGIHLACVATIGIATIAASINAGGLGTLLFDGLRTMNIVKILWGSILAASLALTVNGLFSVCEKKIRDGIELP